MSTVLAQAQIILTADTARFTQEITNARNLSVNSFDDIKKSAQEIAKISFMGVVAGATAGATALAAMTVEQVKLGAELAKTAQLANTSVTNIQKYTIVAKTAGIEQDKLGDIFKDTQDKIGDYLNTGGGELTDFMKNVGTNAGLTAEKLRHMSGPDGLQAMYDAMEKANLSMPEQINYMESIADEASLLIPYLRDGGKGFEAWGNAAEQAGAKMDEKTLRATQKLKTSTDLLDLSFQGVKNQISAAFMPVLSDLATDLVKDATLKHEARKAGDMLAVGFKFMAKTGLGAVATFDMMGTALGGLLAMVGQLGNGVDWNSPYAFFQVGKNFWENNKAAAQIGVNVLDDLSKKMDSYANKMAYMDKLGTGNGSKDGLVDYLTNLRLEQEKIQAALSKTGKELKEETEAKEKNAKATAKLANEQARLVGISGNSGIGSGAHLDIRASGGGRRLTSAELARFQADGKPLTAYRKTSDYGYRGDIGVAGASKYHRGIDFAMPVGTPITTKVAIKDIKSFYDSKGGGYVQRILFADGLSVDLLHQSPASKGIKGGSSGIKSPYTRAQDETSQLIAQQQAEAAKDAQQQAKEAERAAKEQLDLQEKLKAEYANEDAKRTIEHQNKLKEIAKVNNAKLQRELIIQENARFKNANDKAQLEYDVKFQKATEWQQSEEERIIANAELERREAALTLTNDVKLRQAKIDAINQAEQVALDKARRDFESELSSITSYAKSEVQKIRDDFTARRSAIDMRTDINDAQKSDLRNALAGQQNDAIRIARKSAADPYNSMMAEFNGTTELLNLKNQLDQRLEIIKKAKAEEVATVEQAERAKAKAEQNYWYASYQLQATQSANIIDSVANMGKIMFGETSSSYKRLFALSQSFVMAQAGLNMYKAISDGWAQGATLPQKLAAASVAGAEMLKIITAAQQIKMQGFMDGGYTGNIPTNARAGYVHGQEYVFDAPSTKAIGVKNLERIRKGEGIGGDTNINVNVTVNSDGTSSVESQQQLGKNIGDAVNAAIQKALLKERRQGGMLSGAR